MQPADKFKSDIDRTLRRSAGDAKRAAEALDSLFRSSFPAIPEETRAALLSGFPALWRADRERAASWLGCVGSILLMDYDGTPLAEREWAEIRDAVSMGADELDLDFLSYAMSLVVDHGAI